MNDRQLEYIASIAYENSKKRKVRGRDDRRFIK